jgi:glutamate-1-semialdehyde aminotransferase
MSNKICFNQDYPCIDESDKIYKRGTELIPSGTQTLAKGPGQYVKGIAPKYLVRGKGAHVWDADDNEYIDFNMGIGPLSLGYCVKEIDEAIKNQLDSGITFSLMHPLEVEVAELIREVIPNAEAVRFSKTGADVTSAAIRLARAYTGRNKVLCCGYHGWHDWYIAVTDRNKGIPKAVEENSYTFNYNDIESLINSIDEDIAAVILEPFVFEKPNEEFLHNIRDICDKYGIVLIFDEMWTGFRISLGGAQEYFNVKADLACFSKAVANGMPLAILTGRWDIMKLLEKEVFFFTTFGGEALSLAAAKATIEFMKKNNVQEGLRYKGEILQTGFNKIAGELGMEYAKCSGFPCRTIVSFEPFIGNGLIIKSYMQQELIKCGILWSGFHNMSFSHSDEDIQYTLAAYSEILPKLKEAIENKKINELLKGEPVEPVFRKTGSFNMKPKKKISKIFSDFE